jgi:hypothetical protein
MFRKVKEEERSVLLKRIGERKAFYRSQASEAKGMDEHSIEESMKGCRLQLEIIERMIKNDHEVFLDEDDLMLLGE